jgi:hypothetical protein
VFALGRTRSLYDVGREHDHDFLVMTPDGRTLVFQQRGTAGSWDISTLSLDGDPGASGRCQPVAVKTP